MAATGHVEIGALEGEGCAGGDVELCLGSAKNKSVFMKKCFVWPEKLSLLELDDVHRRSFPGNVEETQLLLS